MPYFVFEDRKIYFEENKAAHKRWVVLLHGWGQNTEMMAFIGQSLKEHFNILNLDFPGFGKSEEPSRPYSVLDYTYALHALLEDKKIENPIIIGHSFGCRVAIRYSYLYGTYKMVLTGAAGIRDQRTIKWYLRTYSYKVMKWIIVHSPFKNQLEKIQNKRGSEDYRNSSGVMRQTLVKVVNDDIKDLLKDIKSETLLVFGENDTATPLYKGKMMEKLMPNAALVIFEGDDHFAYFNQSARFVRVLDAFFRSDYD